MSTFMACAVVDLRPGVDAGAFLARLGERTDGPVRVWVGEGRRITLYADAGANDWLGDAIAAAAAPETVARAVIGLDHDEYGVEHVVVEGATHGLLRVHHVYVHPGGASDGEGEPTMFDVPVRPDLHAAPDGTVDDVAARTAAAELFGVDPARMESAAERAANAHEALGSVFTPLAPWWEALGATYPIPTLGTATTVIEG